MLELLKDERLGRLWVAVDGENVVGYLALYRRAGFEMSERYLMTKGFE